MSDKLSRERLEEIRALCEAATEGPWIPYPNMHGWHMMIPGEGEHGDSLVLKRELEEANIKFACAAREDIPALLSHIAALEADVKLYQSRLAAVATEREALVDENKQLQAERDYAALEYKREHALRLEIEAAARTVDKHLNSDAIFEEMREVWGNTNTSIWRDVLLRLGSALAALDEEATDETR